MLIILFLFIVQLDWGLEIKKKFLALITGKNLKHLKKEIEAIN